MQFIQNSGAYSICNRYNEIVGYEPLVNDLKQLIQKKQYHVLRIINSETINLYWEIGGLSGYFI